VVNNECTGKTVKTSARWFEVGVKMPGSIIGRSDDIESRTMSVSSDETPRYYAIRTGAFLLPNIIDEHD